MVSATVSTFHALGQQVRFHFSPGPAGNTEPPFVLVHGIGMSYRYFKRLHEELSATADTYSVDLPGFGPNPRPPGILSVQDHGAVLTDALRELGVETCVLVGHSKGAQVVVAAASASPLLAARVVLLGPVVDRERRSVWRQSAALGHDALRETASANYLVLSDYARTGIRWYLRELGPMMEYRIEDEVRRLSCPVLVLRGSRDPVAREPWCRELSEAAPSGALLSIPGQPHVVQHSAPREVAAAVREFVDRPWLGGQTRPDAASGAAHQ